MNIVFMGTPDFAVSALEELVKNHNVTAVFTQPDKPKNRGKKVLFTPVKECALKHGIEVYQPMSLRSGEDAESSLELLNKLNPDCIVVAAYGQILPEAVLQLPRYGCVNIHASLLPKYRGAAPIQRCIIDGETESGVTVMMMEKGLDTGDMLLKKSVSIPASMTAGELHDELAELGGKLICEALTLIENGGITAEKQDDSQSCYASMISKEMCRIDFSQSADKVYDFIRGMSPSPCAYTTLYGKRLKVYFSEKCTTTSDLSPGTVVDAADFTVVCGDKKCIRLSSVQGEGGKRMNASDFLRGNKLENGAVLE